MKRLLIFESSEIVGERLGIRKNIGESAWLRLTAISKRVRRDRISTLENLARRMK